jgi:hypothetical protein
MPNAGKRLHGLGKPPAWRSWYAMRRRCSQSSPHRRWYFDRGITVCERWVNFPEFLADMGHRPAGTSLDRIDNNKGYEPGNCRWATPTEQRNNRRDSKLYTYAGKTMTLTDWIREITGHNERHQHKYAYILRRSLES